MPAALLGLALTGRIPGRDRCRKRRCFLVRWAGAIYEPVLRRVLRHPVLTFATAAVLFAASLWVARDLGAEFMPKLDEGAVALQAWRLPSVALEKSIQDTTRIEQVLMAFPEVETAVSRTGRAEIATDPMGVEISDIIVMLQPQEEWTTLESPENLARVMQKVLEDEDPSELRRRAEAIFDEFDERNLFNPKDRLVVAFDELLDAVVPGNVFSYSQPIELRVQELVAGVRSDLGISLYGDDLDVLKQKGDEIAAVLRTVPGAAEAKAEQIAGLPVLKVDVDRDAIARYGINASDVLDAVAAVGGKIVGQIFEGQKRFALQVRFPADVRKDLETLRRIKISDAQGRQIPVEQLAELSIEQGPLQIFRQKIRRRHLIECNVRGRDVASFVAEAQQRIAERGGPAPRLLAPLGRPVREPGLGLATAGDRGAAGAGADLHPAVLDVQLGQAGGPDLPGRADGGDRRHLRPGIAGDAVLDLGGGGLHRIVRRGGAQRPGAGQLCRAHPRGRRRPRGGRLRGREGTAPTGSHHGSGRQPGLPAHGDGDQRRRGGPAPAGDGGHRRPGQLDPAHAARPADDLPLVRPEG